LREAPATFDLAGFTLDSVSEEIYWTDADGRFVYVNQAACRALGYDRETMLAMAVGDISPDFSREAWTAHWAQLKAAGTLRFEAVQATRSGTLRTVEITSTYINREGREYTCAFSRDISARKTAEAEARERERWFDESQKAGRVGSFRFDLATNAWKSSPTMDEIFGIGPDYPKTLESWIAIVAPSQRDEMAAYYAGIAARGEDFDKSYRIIRVRDGEERWVHGRARFLRDEAGRIVSMSGTISDITESKQAEDALRSSEAKFAGAFANAPLMMAISSVEEGRYIDVNRRFCETVGLPREEIIGRRSTELGLLTPEARTRILEAFSQSGHIDGIELPVFTPDGRVLDCIFGADSVDIGGHSCFLSTALDITDRRRAEEALRRSEEKFAKVFDQAPLLMTLSELSDGRYVDVNRRFTEVSGYSRGEAVGRTSIELGWITPQDRARIVEGIRRDGRVSDIGLELVARDGRRVDCLFYGEIVTVEDRSLLLSIGLDVTDRHRAEEALRRSEERFNLFMENLPAAAFIKDPEGVTLMANRYLRELAGGIDMVNRTTAELFPPEIAAKMISDDRRALAAGLTVVEEAVPDASGNTRHFQTIKFPVPLEGGREVLGGIAVEITDRKRAEEALRAQERILRSLVDANPESLFLLSPDATVVLANRSFAERLGKPIDEVVGRNVRELVADPVIGSRLEQMKDAVTGGKPLVFEDIRGGSTLENRIYPIFGPGGTVEYVAVLAIDITEKIRMQEQLIRSQKLESLGVLAGGIAHDFNNILTSILGNLSFARRMIGADHRAAERLSECQKATVRAGDLTQQLLTFARGGAPVKETVDAVALLREMVPFALHGSNIRGEIETAPGLWPLDADKGQIGQVVNNLLINAKQAMLGGGVVTVRGRNETVGPGAAGSLAAGRYVAITIRDGGCGIPRENIGRIFDPYFTTKEGGTGLGLASVHSIVRRHGGSIEVSSTPGEGTEFLIRLPAAQVTDAPSPVDAGPAIATGSGRILVMDDEPMISSLARMMLDDLGYSAETCADGAEAVERYRDAMAAGEPFRAAILDLTVPGGLGGREAAERILAIDPGATLIVSSGYSSDPVLSAHAEYGFRGVIAKPYAIETLAAELARLTNPLK
jgi:PAS domain S-box-containing protein